MSLKNSKARLKRILGFSAIAGMVTVLILTLSGTGQPLSANANSPAIAELGEEALLPPDADFLEQVSEFGVTQQNWDSPEYAALTFAVKNGRFVAVGKTADLELLNLSKINICSQKS